MSAHLALLNLLSRGAFGPRDKKVSGTFVVIAPTRDEFKEGAEVAFENDEKIVRPGSEWSIPHHKNATHFWDVEIKEGTIDHRGVVTAASGRVSNARCILDVMGDQSNNVKCPSVIRYYALAELGLPEATTNALLEIDASYIGWMSVATRAQRLRCCHLNSRVLALLENPTDEEIAASIRNNVLSVIGAPWLVQAWSRVIAKLSIITPGFFRLADADIEDHPMDNLVFFPELDEAARIRVIRKNPRLIRVLRNPTVAEQMAAVETLAAAIYLIANPAPEVIYKAAESVPEVIMRWDLPEDLQLKIVERKPQIARYIRVPTENVRKFVVTARPDLVSLFPDQAMAAVKKMAVALAYIPDEYQTLQVQLTAVCRDGHTLRYITDPCQEVIDAALKQNPFAAKWIGRPKPVAPTGIKILPTETKEEITNLDPSADPKAHMDMLKKMFERMGATVLSTSDDSDEEVEVPAPKDSKVCMHCSEDLGDDIPPSPEVFVPVAPVPVAPVPVAPVPVVAVTSKDEGCRTQ